LLKKGTSRLSHYRVDRRTPESVVKDAHAQYTGCTHALNAIILILTIECAAWADTCSSHLGEARSSRRRADPGGHMPPRMRLIREMIRSEGTMPGFTDMPM
jgi:hypothetical protein